jgi:hypothetical protein
MLSCTYNRNTREIETVWESTKPFPVTIYKPNKFKLALRGLYERCLEFLEFLADLITEMLPIEL